MLNKLLKFDCTSSGIIRPEFLSVRINCVKSIKLLIASRPLNKFTVQPSDLIFEEERKEKPSCCFCCL
jgi:hypothetical protein